MPQSTEEESEREQSLREKLFGFPVITIKNPAQGIEALLNKAKKELSTMTGKDWALILSIVLAIGHVPISVESLHGDA